VSGRVATLRDLRQQAARDIDQRRRDQAAHVFAWADQRPMYDADDVRPAACLRNTSRQPIYHIKLGWGASGQQSWPVLLPDGEHVVRGAGSSVADGTAAVWAEFQDAAGICWRTTSLGELTEMPSQTDQKAGQAPETVREHPAARPDPPGLAELAVLANTEGGRRSSGPTGAARPISGS
jgi:hypothetical protein